MTQPFSKKNPNCVEKSRMFINLTEKKLTELPFTAEDVGIP